MKSWRTSTIPLINGITTSKISKEQELVFDQLLDLLKPYADTLEVRNKTTSRYELWTGKEYRTNSFHPKRQPGILFAGIQARSQYVGFYFYPLHINPQLQENIPDTLHPFWKGGTAFHFHLPVAEQTSQDLQHLLKTGWDYYEEKRLIV